MFFSRFVGTIQRSSIEPLTFPRYLYYSNKHLRRAAATVSRCEATRESLPPIFPVSVQITIHPNFLSPPLARFYTQLRHPGRIRQALADTLEITRLWPRARGDQLNSKPVIACYIVPLPLDTTRQTEIRNEFRCSRKRGRPYPSSSLFRRWFNDEGEKRRVELCPWMKGETNLRRGCKRGILKSNAERL